MRGFIDGEYQDGELRGLAFLGGKRGMGKTTEMIRLLLTCSGGVAFFDSLSKHESVLKGFVIVTQPGEMKQYLLRNSKCRFRILYQPRSGDLDQHFEAFCQICLAFGSMIIAVDEIDKLCGMRWGESRMPPGLYAIVNYGRHHRVSALATARRPAQVPRGFTSECHEMRLFKLTEERDVKYFAELIGESEARQLPSLQPYQFLRWTDEGDSKRMGGRR